MARSERGFKNDTDMLYPRAKLGVDRSPQGGGRRKSSELFSVFLCLSNMAAFANFVPLGAYTLTVNEYRTEGRCTVNRKYGSWESNGKDRSSKNKKFPHFGSNWLIFP